MWLALVIVTAAFGINFAHYAVSAQVSLAEKDLQADRASDWVTLQDTMQWVDYIAFVLLLGDRGLVYSVLTCAVPSILGARYGERWSVRQDWVSERMKRAKKPKPLASVAVKQ